MIVGGCRAYLLVESGDASLLAFGLIVGGCRAYLLVESGFRLDCGESFSRFVVSCGGECMRLCGTVLATRIPLWAGRI